MLIPLIKVKDKLTGEEHIVGTNTHDALLVEKGEITYYNLQNGEGSSPQGDYQFIGVDSEMGPVVEFVSLQELIDAYQALQQKTEKQEDF